jgi:hypothetical protein
MFHCNPNYRRRDELLGLHDRIWEDEHGMDSAIDIDAISLATLEALVREGFIDPDACQKYSPTTTQFLMFMRRHPAVVAHGYAVSPYRDDYRVSIEGLLVLPEDLDFELQADFEKFCWKADELKLGRCLYSWWD